MLLADHIQTSARLDRIHEARLVYAVLVAAGDERLLPELYLGGVRTAHAIKEGLLLRGQVLSSVGLLTRYRPIVLVVIIPVLTLSFLDVNATKVGINLIIADVALRGADRRQQVELVGVNFEKLGVIKCDKRL